ncbi:YutD family protein [Macrococcus equipercicus]|uniref:DUF1027 domain-containing protein n=1 Tax=Macrococcus equipercicus TaxID=69967 RepID=A0A9Q9BW54_9STAP|nr:YutD family protein [Macrococcus equipercicus]KAA1042526.1 DUF1027 domain-containing protein [Macrococcus equipercicus]UTH14387.1 YutD family protein [Macrococcus equipercicus]
MVIKIGEHYYNIIANYRDAFDAEQFERRYSEVLDKYPVIVGDIGFEQLRLKGFYEDRNKKADISKRFSSIQDYLMEYCNFGCPYFVLKRLPAAERLNEETPVEEHIADERVEIIAEQTDELYNNKTLKQFLK